MKEIAGESISESGFWVYPSGCDGMAWQVVNLNKVDPHKQHGEQQRRSQYRIKWD